MVSKLGDIYGRKWFIVGGIALFLAGSALCGLAWSMTELIIFGDSSRSFWATRP